MKWHKSTDVLPERGKNVLVYEPTWGKFSVMYIHKERDCWYPGGSTNWGKRWSDCLPDPEEVMNGE